jgi:hypothetical protein
MVRRRSIPLLAAAVAALAWAPANAATPLHVIRPGVVPQAVPAKNGGVKLKKLSVDPFTNTSSQHKTEVEPDVASYGNTLVATFQQGRFPDGGASDIGWATSVDGGATWKHGSLPGITNIASPSGTYDADTDPAVAYDSVHGLWLIASLPLIGTGSNSIGQEPIISASTDGLHWNNPVLVTPNNGDFIDKSWITCDNWSTSKYLGHCYTEFDDVYEGDAEQMSTSTNGGKTWTSPFPVGQFGLGGQPLALPNGTAIVPYLDDTGNIWSFSSTNGGQSWGSPVQIAAVNSHGVNGELRTETLPSAAIDGSGKVYVVWQDCSFRSGCSSNDIVMSTSTDGTHWSAKARIPIDQTTSGVDHFIPGIGADVTTGGSTGHLALTYYYYPSANCSFSTCQLTAGSVTSEDGGNTWSAPTTLTKPISMSWIASTDQGVMVGDYIATAFAGGKAFGVFANAKAPKNGKFDEYMVTPKGGLTAAEGAVRYSSRGEHPLANAHSDHPRHYPPPSAHAVE